MSKTQAWATGYSKINITLGPAYPQVKERVTCDTLSGSWAMQLELVESSRTSHLVSESPARDTCLVLFPELYSREAHGISLLLEQSRLS